MRLPNIKFRKLEVRKNEIALRKLSCGTTQLPSCALWWEHSVRILYVRASYYAIAQLRTLVGTQCAYPVRKSILLVVDPFNKAVRIRNSLTCRTTV